MSENFSQRMNELPGFLSHHLMLTVIALGVGIAISVPLAVALVRLPKWRYPVLTTAGVIQTVPSLALLALMVPILAALNTLIAGLPLVTEWSLVPFGFWPAVIALTLYSILPILRNTVTGILGVDPNMTEAARGLGMSNWQTLWHVQLPLAAPVIIAGIRTSTVWVVGIATLATPVGQTCLGDYIFTGLQTRNWLMVMFGVVAAAALAILLDTLIGLLQKAVELRHRVLQLGASSGLALIMVGGLAAPTLVEALRSDQTALTTRPATAMEHAPLGTIRIGTKTFTEQYILARVIQGLLEDEGIRTERVSSLGSTIIFDALANGDIDLYVDYTGTIWANHMQRDEAPPPWHVTAVMNGWLIEEHGIRNLGALGFENAYALAMRREKAETLDIETMTDLARHASDMKIGGDYEFFGRPEWAKAVELYGLQFKDQVSYDSSIMYEAVAKGEVDAISAFSSDGRIEAYDLKVLDDPRHAFPPYDAILLLNKRVADHPRLINILKPLVGNIPIERMRQANYMVDRDEDSITVSEAAKWLKEEVTQSSNASSALPH